MPKYLKSISSSLSKASFRSIPKPIPPKCSNKIIDNIYLGDISSTSKK